MPAHVLMPEALCVQLAGRLVVSCESAVIHSLTHSRGCFGWQCPEMVCGCCTVWPTHLRRWMHNTGSHNSGHATGLCSAQPCTSCCAWLAPHTCAHAFLHMPACCNLQPWLNQGWFAFQQDTQACMLSLGTTVFMCL
jgi:hypothetical protein